MNTNPTPPAPPKSGLNHNRICREESDTPQPRKCHWTQTGTLEWGRWSLRPNGHVRIDGVDRAVPELKTVTPATSCERVTDRPSC